MSMLLQLWRLLDTRQRRGFLLVSVLALVMVDGLTESEVMETIEGLRGQCTIILIAVGAVAGADVHKE
jgi:hypothetical protein